MFYSRSDELRVVGDYDIAARLPDGSSISLGQISVVWGEMSPFSESGILTKILRLPLFLPRTCRFRL